MLCYSTALNLKSRKFLGKTKMAFVEIVSQHHKFWQPVRVKNLEVTLLFVDFSKAFDSIRRGKMKQILLAYRIPRVAVAAIIRFYKITKVKVRSTDWNTEFFDFLAGVLQANPFAPYLFIIFQDYLLRTSIDSMKENGLTLEKARNRRYAHTNNYGCVLRWWHTTSSKYTRPGLISAA